MIRKADTAVSKAFRGREKPEQNAMEQKAKKENRKKKRKKKRKRK